MSTLVSKPAGPLKHKDLRVPGDKSITHRALILGALANGETKIKGRLKGDDCNATLAALKACGVKYKEQGDILRINGVGLEGLRKPPGGELDFGNSGTGMRLMCGVLAGRDFDVTLTGDESLRRRPMQRIIKPLREMGADICSLDDDGTPPLKISRSGRLKSLGDYKMDVASAQVQSCLLLAGLRAESAMCVRGTSDKKIRNHMSLMLKRFGVSADEKTSETVIEVGEVYQGALHPKSEAPRYWTRVCISPGELKGAEIYVSGDFSSAIFFIVAATITPDSDILLKDVGVNPTRTAALDILKKMGACIEKCNTGVRGNEEVADIHVCPAPQLKGVTIPPEIVANAIDDFPALFIAAAYAHGETRLSGAEELRAKESDRIATMAAGLRKLGVKVDEPQDGITIRGKGGKLDGGVTVDGHGDHRVSMAFLVAGAASKKEITVERCENIATSFPGFVESANAVNMKVSPA